MAFDKAYLTSFAVWCTIWPWSANVRAMSFELPAGVVRAEGPGGLTRYLIDTPHCSGEVFELGATVTGWAPAGHSDTLWVSAESSYRLGRPIRGGIPICAPWFGAGRGIEPVPQSHGFVRAVPWRLSGARQDGPVIELTFDLGPGDVAGQPGVERYPLDLTYRYTARFGPQLDVALTVTSPSSPVVIDEALHTYFAVSDVRTVLVRGLDGVSYLDKTQAGADGVQSGDIQFSAETDRVYAGAPVTEIIDGQRLIRLTPRGSASTVVWNPWRQRAREMGEFGDEEWTSMVCVETANALDRAVSVPAGGSTTLGVTISRP